MNDFKIPMGTLVEDKVTGYKGQVVARYEFLYGCRRYGIQAKELKDGKPVESITIDEDACKVLKLPKEEHKTINTGGPTREPPKRTEPARSDPKR